MTLLKKKNTDSPFGRTLDLCNQMGQTTGYNEG